jgi:hypothetical protein
MGEEAGEALGLIVIEPGVDGVGVAAAEQAGAGDGMGGGAVGDLEQRGGALADVGLGVVIPVVEQFVALLGAERKGTALGHRRSPLWFRYPILALLPFLSVKVHQGAPGFELKLGDSDVYHVGFTLYWQDGDIDRTDADAVATITAGDVDIYGDSDKTTGAHIVTTGTTTSYIDLGNNGTRDYILYLDKGVRFEHGAGTLEHTSGTIDDTAHASHEFSLVKNASGALWKHPNNSTVLVSVGFFNEGQVQIQDGTFTIDDVSSSINSVYGFKQTGIDPILNISSGATLKVTNGGNAGQVYVGAGELQTTTVAGKATPKLLTNVGAAKGTVTVKNAAILLGGTAVGALDLDINNLVLSGTTTYYCDIDSVSGCDKIYTEGKVTITAGDDVELRVTVYGTPPANAEYQVIRAGDKAGTFADVSAGGLTDRGWDNDTGNQTFPWDYVLKA